MVGATRIGAELGVFTLVDERFRAVTTLGATDGTSTSNGEPSTATRRDTTSDTFAIAISAGDLDARHVAASPAREGAWVFGAEALTARDHEGSSDNDGLEKGCGRHLLGGDVSLVRGARMQQE